MFIVVNFSDKLLQDYSARPTVHTFGHSIVTKKTPTFWIYFLLSLVGSTPTPSIIACSGHCKITDVSKGPAATLFSVDCNTFCCILLSFYVEMLKVTDVS